MDRDSNLLVNQVGSNILSSNVLIVVSISTVMYWDGSARQNSQNKPLSPSGVKTHEPLEANMVVSAVSNVYSRLVEL